MYVEESLASNYPFLWYGLFNSKHTHIKVTKIPYRENSMKLVSIKVEDKNRKKEISIK